MNGSFLLRCPVRGAPARKTVFSLRCCRVGPSEDSTPRGAFLQMMLVLRKINLESAASIALDSEER